MKTTKCLICGTKVEYTTKKPKTCPACKDAKTTAKAQKPAGKSKYTHKTKWKAETKLFQLLDQLIPKADYCVNGYYSWLPSPTGSPMQLDWYSYELGIAFEYNGAQHYTFNKYFHKTKKAFNYLQECDKIKAELCGKEGVVLVEIKYNVELNVRTIAHQIKRASETLYLTLLNEGILNLTKEDLEAINKM